MEATRGLLTLMGSITGLVILFVVFGNLLPTISSITLAMGADTVGGSNVATIHGNIMSTIFKWVPLVVLTSMGALTLAYLFKKETQRQLR